jgi:hypothetical protein
MHTNISRRSNQLAGLLSREWLSSIRLGLNFVESQLTGYDLGAVLSHRDFSYWNMRAHKGGLIVFDWEYASAGYLPSYDFFHFHLHPIAINRKWSSAEILKMIMFSDDWARRSKSSMDYAKAELVAYLLDLSLTYLDANNGDERGSVILQNYRELIDTICT